MGSDPGQIRDRSEPAGPPLGVICGPQKVSLKLRGLGAGGRSQRSHGKFLRKHRKLNIPAGQCADGQLWLRDGAVCRCVYEQAFSRLHTSLHGPETQPHVCYTLTLRGFQLKT